MEGQGLFHPLLQAGHRGYIEQAQLLPDPLERSLGFGVGSFFIGFLEFSPPGGLLGLGQVGYDVLPFMPLTTL